MAQHHCPKCKKYGFNWHRDDDDIRTEWGCYHCHYGAYEDESFERPCGCEKGGSLSRLKDEKRMYWWCCRCDKSFESDAAGGLTSIEIHQIS
jgi:hypothetical protein